MWGKFISFSWMRIIKVFVGTTHQFHNDFGKMNVTNLFKEGDVKNLISKAITKRLSL